MRRTLFWFPSQEWDPSAFSNRTVYVYIFKYSVISAEVEYCMLCSSPLHIISTSQSPVWIFIQNLLSVTWPCLISPKIKVWRSWKTQLHDLSSGEHSDFWNFFLLWIPHAVLLPIKWKYWFCSWSGLSKWKWENSKYNCTGTQIMMLQRTGDINSSALVDFQAAV